MLDPVLHLVIPAAGLGTRMTSISHNSPKEMLCVGNKPAIQYAVEEGLSTGIQEITIIISRRKEIIRRYFEDEAYRLAAYPLAAQDAKLVTERASFNFLYQERPDGEADAISLSRTNVGDHAFALIYPDVIYFPAPGALKALSDVFTKTGQDVVALTNISEAEAVAGDYSGKIKLSRASERIYRVEKVLSKGTQGQVPLENTRLRGCGFAVLGPHFFSCIDKARARHDGGEFTDGSVYDVLLEDRSLLGYHLPGRVFDVGSPLGYRDCQSYLSLQTMRDS